MAEVARRNCLAAPELDGELRVGVSDWSCRVLTDDGREKLPGGGSRCNRARRCGYTCDLLQAKRWDSNEAVAIGAATKGHLDPGWRAMGRS